MNLSTTGLSLTADAVVDLHLHTTYSDGCWTPEPLLDHLRREGFSLAAIADHDRADTATTIQQLALDKYLPVLVAVEMSTTWKGEMVDLLCFGFEADRTALNDLAQGLLRRQQENTRQVCDNLQRQGYAFPPDALSAILEDGFVTFDVELLDQFRQEASIDGLEVYYPLHTPAQTEMYREYAQRHRLLTSAGSDSHGPDKPPIKYRAELSRSLLERVGIQVE
jgi:predicted metal-dependent phosphoesterase TrpH